LDENVWSLKAAWNLPPVPYLREVLSHAKQFIPKKEVAG